MSYLPGTTPDYAHAQCGAITRAGKRCTGRWHCAVPTVYGADAVTGDSVDGPWLALCHRHRHLVYDGYLKGDGATLGHPEHFGRRVRVAYGWLGAANAYGYATAVFAEPTGWAPASWWWERRRASSFGGDSRRDAA